MTFPIRAILVGLLAGAAFYFAPFHFPFFFLFLFLFIIIRLFFGRRWRRNYGYGPRWRQHYGDDYYNDIVPIDGGGAYRTGQPGGKEKKVPIQ